MILLKVCGTHSCKKYCTMEKELPVQLYDFSQRLAYTSPDSWTWTRAEWLNDFFSIDNGLYGCMGFKRLTVEAKLWRLSFFVLAKLCILLEWMEREQRYLASDLLVQPSLWIRCAINLATWHGKASAVSGNLWKREVHENSYFRKLCEA